MTPPASKEPSSRFADVYDATADSMRAQLRGAQSGLDHSGSRGAAAEAIFLSFLRTALPASLGITRGQVVDSHGNFSGQCDAIIYNLARTPMLFSGGEAGEHTVPIEGVVGVVEVKSHLQKKDLAQLVGHAQRLKSLDRRAYFARAHAPKYRLYDQDWENPPVMYTVFAFNSDGLYVRELNEMHREVPLHMRVDNLCALDRGLALNVCATGHVDDPQNLITFSPTATQVSGLGEVLTDQPLPPWVAMNSSVLVQAECPPINLGVYFQDRLHLNGTMPPGQDGAIRGELHRQVAEKIGVAPGVVAKLDGSSKEPATGEDLLSLLDPYGRGQFEPGTTQLKDLMDLLLGVPVERRAEVLAAVMLQSDETKHI